MSKREKEEERIERIIRGLLKLPENRRCINCNSLGPQYVCTTFLTFVCTNCSGVHREFTHRVKSVSMAKFTAEEVSALQAGGNERARQLYFKEWDPQLNSYPDGSNLHRLRDFIKHVYVDRKYTGERSNERLPRLRLGDIEDSYESRRVGAYHVGSRSPSYDDRYEYSEKSARGGRNEDRSFRYYYDERRSPRYSRENSRSGGYKKSPVRFEVVDDRIRDNGTRSSRLPDSRKFAESGIGSRSPDPEKHMDRSRSPAVRPAKDVLGDKALPLQLGDRSEAAKRDTKDSGKNQLGTSSGRSATNDKNPLEHKSQNPQSLIDFDSDSKSADATATPQAQQNHLPGHGGNHSSESSMKNNAPPAPKPNTLEFLLLELSGPPLVPASSVSETLANVNSSTASVPTPDGFSAAGPPGQMLGLPSGASASTNASAGIVPMGSVAAAAPLGQIPTLPTSRRASTTASRGNLPLGSIASAAPGAQMSTLPNSTNASIAEYGGNMFVGGVSQAAPASKIFTSSSVGASAAPSGGSVPNADVSPAAFMGQTLTLLDASASPATTNLHEQPPNGDSQSAPDMSDGSTFKVPNEQLASSSQQHQPSAYPAMHDPSNGRKLINASVGAPNNRMPTSPNVHETQGLSITSNENISENASKPTRGSNSGVKSQPLPLKTKTGGRRELPADIFTANLPPAPGPFQGWQTGQSYGMGYNMQYHTNAVPGLAYTNPANSMNPFDVNNETSLAQAQLFPSFGNMRAALPNVPPTAALLHTSSIDSNSSGFMAPPSLLYPSAMASPSLPPSSAMPTGSHKGQQVHMAMPPSRPQGASGVGVDEALFGLSNVGQQPPSGFSLSVTPNSFPPKVGNPFG